MKAELNTLETQIKDQIDSRTIQPSAQAWEKINEMLTDNHKPKKKFGWLFVAACFIGLLFVSTYFFNQNSFEDDVVVTEKRIGEIKKNKAIERIEKNQKNEKTAEVEKDKQNAEIITINKPIICVFFKPVKDENQEVKEKVLAENNNFLNENQVINHENLIVENPKLITKNPQPLTLKVDPALLLNQVDGELTLSFREKVIKKYKETKVALAERNIEN